MAAAMPCVRRTPFNDEVPCIRQACSQIVPFAFVLFEGVRSREPPVAPERRRQGSRARRVAERVFHPPPPPFPCSWQGESGAGRRDRRFQSAANFPVSRALEPERRSAGALHGRPRPCEPEGPLRRSRATLQQRLGDHDGANPAEDFPARRRFPLPPVNRIGYSVCRLGREAEADDRIAGDQDVCRSRRGRRLMASRMRVGVVPSMPGRASRRLKRWTTAVGHAMGMSRVDVIGIIVPEGDQMLHSRG